MNNKGFTLIELLAVIIILSLLALITSTAVTNLVKDSKKDLYNTQIELIKSAAEVWGADNLKVLPENGECKYLTLKELKGYGLLDSSVINPKTNEEFSDDLKIKISGNLTDYGTMSYIYEVDSTDVSTCDSIYPTICTGVTSEIKTSGNVPNGLYNSGDEYICEVKPGTSYHFFVVSTDENKVNLILNNNVYYNSDSDTGLANSTNPGAVAWYATEVNSSYGPVAAMQYLYNATKDWINIPALTYEYYDSEIRGNGTGYTSFKSKNGVATITSATEPIVESIIGTPSQPLRARMPIFSSETAKTELKSKADAPYLYDTQGGSNGYWTLSTFSPSQAYIVIFFAQKDVIASQLNASMGVRPVISIPKYNIS